MNDVSLKNIVEELLDKRCEGDYWDFKLKWHDNIADLIKDIICFVNTPHERDCYLIFGISDNYEVVGVSDNRYKLANINDTLSTLYFANIEMPIIELNTVEFAGKIIDVLTIKNTENVPVFLKRQYGKMLPGCIYTRVGDKNTPDNGNASYDEIQMLWKKRLGLTKSKLEFVKHHLKNKSEWVNGGDHKKNKEYYYNIYKPEYTLEIFYETPEDGIKYLTPYYAYEQINDRFFFKDLQIKCYDTVLDEFSIVVLDSGRFETIIPHDCYLGGRYEDKEEISFGYYIRGTIEFELCNFLYQYWNKEQEWAHDSFMELMIIFDNENQFEDFKDYINQNRKEILKEIKTPKEIDIREEEDIYARERATYLISSSKVIKKWFDKFIN